jgi:hypothetical protein
VNEAAALASTLRELLSFVGDPTWTIWKRLEELALSENLPLESIEFSNRHARLGMHAVLLRDPIDTEFRTTQLQALSARMDDLTAR